MGMRTLYTRTHNDNDEEAEAEAESPDRRTANAQRTDAEQTQSKRTHNAHPAGTARTALVPHCTRRAQRRAQGRPGRRDARGGFSKQGAAARQSACEAAPGTAGEKRRLVQSDEGAEKQHLVRSDGGKDGLANGSGAYYAVRV
ncbi:hypothetical protein DAKH74_042660 [Maudiozyma humilis]|uniref:Uncharacterized protein n=1 Tax=Maudiozyma humilis TaxID=51915 RepID=A0AAV5S1W8_MAUHU|nr:hypothetical protein DAKH74_042660 [Kazachstania humilis]